MKYVKIKKWLFVSFGCPIVTRLEYKTLCNPLIIPSLGRERQKKCKFQEFKIKKNTSDKIFITYL